MVEGCCHFDGTRDIPHPPAKGRALHLQDLRTAQQSGVQGKRERKQRGPPPAVSALPKYFCRMPFVWAPCYCHDDSFSEVAWVLYVFVCCWNISGSPPKKCKSQSQLKPHGPSVKPRASTAHDPRGRRKASVKATAARNLRQRQKLHWQRKMSWKMKLVQLKSHQPKNQMMIRKRGWAIHLPALFQFQ